MKGTILYAEYDEGTGISKVIKQTKYGTFTRSVRVHPDDKDVANRYDGCYFAELKCDIAAYQERAKFMRERAKGITHAFKVLSYADAQAADWMDEMNPEWYRLAHQADVAWKQAEDAADTYHILKDAYYALIEQTLRQRRELREKINKKRNSQN